MKQMTLAAAADSTAGSERFRKPTRPDAFLAEMQTLVPWAELVALIEPHYPKPGNGRPPIGLERMLRIHLLQHWFNLADAARQEALYDSAALRGFAGIDLGREPVPDATTILKFRHLLERHDLGRAVFAGTDDGAEVLLDLSQPLWGVPIWQEPRHDRRIAGVGFDKIIDKSGDAGCAAKAVVE